MNKQTGNHTDHRQHVNLKDYLFNQIVIRNQRAGSEVYCICKEKPGHNTCYQPQYERCIDAGLGGLRCCTDGLFKYKPINQYGNHRLDKSPNHAKHSQQQHQGQQQCQQQHQLKKQLETILQLIQLEIQQVKEILQHYHILGQRTLYG